MKSNKDQTEQEFAFTFACKRMMNDLAYVQNSLEGAKHVGMQGDSDAALRNVEGRLYDLKAAVLNALKTVGI